MSCHNIFLCVIGYNVQCCKNVSISGSAPPSQHRFEFSSWWWRTERSNHAGVIVLNIENMNRLFFVFWKLHSKFTWLKKLELTLYPWQQQQYYHFLHFYFCFIAVLLLLFLILLLLVLLLTLIFSNFIFALLLCYFCNNNNNAMLLEKNKYEERKHLLYIC